jgi:phytoene synthase
MGHAASDAIGAVEGLALAWQPPSSKELLAGVFALDARLARRIGSSKEPLIVQITLAWWRERLMEHSRADPLLAKLVDDWGGSAAALVPLVDGWEELLGDSPLPRPAIEGFASGRGLALEAVARRLGNASDFETAKLAGQRWALAHWAFRTPSLIESDRALELAEALPPPQPLSHPLRGIAVLDGIAARAVARRRPMLEGRGAALLALRVGLLGR